MPNDRILWNSEEQRRAEWAFAEETLAPEGVLAPNGTKLRRTDVYDLCLMYAAPSEMRRNKLYICIENTEIYYSCIAPSGELISKRPLNDHNTTRPYRPTLETPITTEQLDNLDKKKILEMTSKRSHTTSHSFIVTDGRLLAIAGKGQILGQSYIGTVKIAEDKSGRVYTLEISPLNLSEEGQIAMDLGMALHSITQRQSTSSKERSTRGAYTKYYLPYQYLGESLNKYLVRHAIEGPEGERASRLSDDATYTLAIKLSMAVHAFHTGLFSRTQTKYVHGDLHPNNIVIDKKGNPHLINFKRSLVLANAPPFSGMSKPQTQEIERLYMISYYTYERGLIFSPHMIKKTPDLLALLTRKDNRYDRFHTALTFATKLTLLRFKLNEHPIYKQDIPDAQAEKLVQTLNDRDKQIHTVYHALEALQTEIQQTAEDLDLMGKQVASLKKNYKECLVSEAFGDHEAAARWVSEIHATCQDLEDTHPAWKPVLECIRRHVSPDVTPQARMASEQSSAEISNRETVTHETISEASKVSTMSLDIRRMLEKERIEQHFKYFILENEDSTIKLLQRYVKMYGENVDDTFSMLINDEELFKIEIQSFIEAAKMRQLAPQSVAAQSIEAVIKIDTNEAVIYDKRLHHCKCYAEDVLYDTYQDRWCDTITDFQDEEPVLVTTQLTACIVVYIESDNLSLALHANPSQAKGTYPGLNPYRHLDYADLPRGTEISVMVAGHTENFNENIFRAKIAEKGLVIKELRIGTLHPCTILAAFNFKQRKLTIERVNAAPGDPKKFEELHFTCADPALQNAVDLISPPVHTSLQEEPEPPMPNSSSFFREPLNNVANNFVDQSKTSLKK